MDAKAHHFSAVSEYRESIVEYEASRSVFKFLITRILVSALMTGTALNLPVFPRRWRRPRSHTMWLKRARSRLLSYRMSR